MSLENVFGLLALDETLATRFIPESSEETGVLLGAYGGIEYTPNIGAAADVPGGGVVGDTWYGTWASVDGFAEFAVSTSFALLGRGWAEFSIDGGLTVHHAYTTLFGGGGGSFAGTVYGATHFRLVFQNQTPVPSTFKARTVGRQQQGGIFTFPIAAPIDPSFPAGLVKAAITGQQPDGDFANQPLSGSSPGNSRVAAAMGAGAVFTGTPFDSTGWTSVAVVVKADQVSAAGGLLIEFSNDGFATVFRQHAFTYGAADVGSGRLYAVAANQGETFRVRYTNGATPATAVELRTELVVNNVQAQLSPLETPLDAGSSAVMQRAVVSGKRDDGSGVYANVAAHDDNLGASLLTAQGHRISQVLGRTHHEVRGTGLAVSSTIHTVDAGKDFYVHTILLSIVNASSIVDGRIRLRDGGAAGTVKASAVANEASASANTTANVSLNLTEPMLFGTDVFLEIVSGIITADAVLVGYLEAT